jgi:hypothetical protein
MMKLIPHAFDGELLGRQECVRVIGTLHPLREGRVERDLPAGLSVAELVAEAFGDEALERSLLISLSRLLDGEWHHDQVREAVFHRVRPKAGTVVTVQPAIRGKNALQIVLTIAAVVIAAIVAPYLAGALFTAGSIGFFTASAVISAGILYAANLAINALFPIRPPQLDDGAPAFKTLPGIAGAQNQGNPYGPVPELLGRHRISPFYGAKAYTEVVGDDQYVRMLFVWGYGPMEFSDHKIGESLLTTFEDYEMQERQGFPDDPPITLFPEDVDEQSLQIELISANGYINSRTTATDADEISIDITAPEGVFIQNDDGKILPFQVMAQARYRPVGAGDDAWAYFPNIVFNMSTKTARLGARVSVARGQYEVQVTRATADRSELNLHSRMIWTALRTFTNRPPVAFGKPLAMTALRIRATDQLNGVVDTFNAIGKRLLVKAYDGSGSPGDWTSNTFSQNPADEFRHVLQGPANARPRSDSEIDIVNLQEWWVYCRDKGFTFNQYRSDRSSVYDCLADIAAAGRAVPTFIDGKWGVIWDRPDDDIVNHFTPRNSWDFSGSRAYARLPHAFRVKFINADNGYTQDERTVYDDGYDEGSATLFESIEFPGVTDHNLIWRHGRFHIAQARLRPEKVSFLSNWEHSRCNRGDRVKLTHDVMLIGQTSGRIKSVADASTEEGTFTKVVVDEICTIETDKTYAISLRLPDGTCLSRSVEVLVTGEVTEITFTGEIPASDDAQLSAGDLFAFGESERESANYRVFSIEHQKDLVARLTLVDDAPAISEADEGDIPDYDAHVTLPIDPYNLPPRELKYYEFIKGDGLNARPYVHLSWQPPHRGTVMSYQVQSIDDSGSAWKTVDSVPAPKTNSDVFTEHGGIWSFRVRCLFTNGTGSSWQTIPNLNLLGLLLAPDDVTNLRATYISERLHLTWQEVEDNRGKFYEVRKGDSPNSALTVGTALTQAIFQTVGDGIYWVAAYVITPFGDFVYSDNWAEINLDASVLLANVVVTHDERTDGWNGYYSGTIGRDDTQRYIRTSGQSPFVNQTDVLGLADFLNSGGQDGGYYFSRTVVNIGRVARCRISVDWDAIGVAEDDDFLGQPSLLENPDFLKSYLSRFIRVRPVVRIAQTGPGDIFGPGIIDTFTESDIFTGDVTWESKLWSPDEYLGQMFQMGLFFEILHPDGIDPKTIAYATKFIWTIDVPDRQDSYLNLAIPAIGYHIDFTPRGESTPAAFHGGPNAETDPHIQGTLLQPHDGDRVEIRNLTLAGCDVFVSNGGSDIARNGVNIFAWGY